MIGGGSGTLAVPEFAFDKPRSDPDRRSRRYPNGKHSGRGRPSVKLAVATESFVPPGESTQAHQ